MALDLSELERSGAKFIYPDGLAAPEWGALRGLTRGRERAEGLKQERERKEERIKKAKGRMNDG
jgi:hypothetical protein